MDYLIKEIVRGFLKTICLVSTSWLKKPANLGIMSGAYWQSFRPLIISFCYFSKTIMIAQIIIWWGCLTTKREKV